MSAVVTGLDGLNDLPLGSIVMCTDGQARRVVARVDGENLWERFGSATEDMTSADLIIDSDMLNVLPIFPVLWRGGDDHEPTDPIVLSPENVALINIDRIARAADRTPPIQDIIDELNTLPATSRRE